MILETERLRLREFIPKDADALAAVLGDPVAMRYYPAPFNRREVEHWIERNRQRYQREGYGLWAMLLRDSDEVIGDCGCYLREIEGRSGIEIAYHVRRDLQGNGVISLIRPENLQSIRVAEKNGMTCEKIIFRRGNDHCIYTVGVETWHCHVSDSNSR